MSKFANWQVDLTSAPKEIQGSKKERSIVPLFAHS